VTTEFGIKSHANYGEKKKKCASTLITEQKERDDFDNYNKKRQCFFLQTRLVHDCNLKGISMFKKIYNTFVLLLLLYKLPAAIFLKKQKQTLPIYYTVW